MRLRGTLPSFLLRWRFSRFRRRLDPILAPLGRLWAYLGLILEALGSIFVKCLHHVGAKLGPLARDVALYVLVELREASRA